MSARRRPSSWAARDIVAPGEPGGDGCQPQVPVPVRGSVRSFILRHFVAIVALLAAAGYVTLYANRPDLEPIRSDGLTYHVYLPSWFIYRDVSLEAVARDCCGGRFPDYTAIIRWPSTGRWVNAHPIGVAVLSAPFFGLAHALTRWSNLSPDGFSFYYQHLAAMAGLTYLLAGLAVLRTWLRRRFSDGVTLATLATLTWGTNLFHYGTFDATYSHTFSFCAIVGLMAVTERWWKAPSWRTSAALGALAALIVLIRHPNALVLAAVPLYGVTSWSDLREQGARLWSWRWRAVAALGVAALCVAPQLALYHRATGSWLVSSYGELRPSFLSPHLFGVLVSPQKGLFFWSPVLLFALAGLTVARGCARQWRVAALVVFVLDAYVIASWWDWQYGGSFGHRGFTDILGLLAIFLAAFFAWAAERPRVTQATAIVAGVLVALSTAQMIQYWLGVLPMSDTTWARYWELFLTFR